LSGPSPRTTNTATIPHEPRRARQQHPDLCRNRKVGATRTYARFFLCVSDSAESAFAIASPVRRRPALHRRVRVSRTLGGETPPLRGRPDVRGESREILLRHSSERQRILRVGSPECGLLPSPTIENPSRSFR
jgi:hypothetical protein